MLISSAMDRNLSLPRRNALVESPLMPMEPIRNWFQTGLVSSVSMSSRWNKAGMPDKTRPNRTGGLAKPGETRTNPGKPDMLPRQKIEGEPGQTRPNPGKPGWTRQHPAKPEVDSQKCFCGANLETIFGTKSSWFQTGSKLVPNWFQMFGTNLEPKRVGSKPVWNQLVLVPNWFQTGSKCLEPILGPSWGQLGVILGPRGAILGPLGAILEPTWGHLGFSWGHLVSCWG